MIEEPTVRVFLMTPGDYIGDMMNLVLEKRGQVEHTETLDATRILLTCTLPLNEILVDFNDRLKSASKGYASMDYEHSDYQQSKLVKMDILINAEPVDAFSSIVHMDKSRLPRAGISVPS